MRRITTRLAPELTKTGIDPDANSALWRIAIVRMATDRNTRNYTAREVYNALPFQAIA